RNPDESGERHSSKAAGFPDRKTDPGKPEERKRKKAEARVRFRPIIGSGRFRYSGEHDLFVSLLPVFSCTNDSAFRRSGGNSLWGGFVRVGIYRNSEYRGDSEEGVRRGHDYDSLRDPDG